jgi:PPOX class probable F420-dependent enzyme
MFDRLRHRSALDVSEDGAVGGDLQVLREHRHALLVTFRRDGTAVPTPVWFGISADRLYVKTSSRAGKVKRLRHDDRVVVAPCTPRGKPIGPGILGVGRELETSEQPKAEAALSSAYGAGRRIAERVAGALGEPATYIEVSARPRR